MISQEFVGETNSRPLSDLEVLCAALTEARRWLPEQGPVGVFVHHNTLHHFEHLSFENAVEKVARQLGTEPYMAHQSYIDAFVKGRVSGKSLRAVVSECLDKGQLDLNPPVLAGMRPEKFYRKLLFVPRYHESETTIQWLIQEGGYLDRFVPQVSEHSREKMRRQTEARLQHKDRADFPFTDEQLDRHTLCCLWDWLVRHIKSPTLEATAANVEAFSEVDEKVNQNLISFLSAYTDQGIAYWPMPDRDKGMLGCFLALLRQGERGLPAHCYWVPDSAHRRMGTEGDSTTVVLSILRQLGVPREDWVRFLLDELLKLPGWAGMVALLEHRTDLLPVREIPLSLCDFVAIRLLLLSAQRAGTCHLRHGSRPIKISDRAMSLRFELFHLFQSSGMGVEDLETLTPAVITALNGILDDVDDHKRRQILHRAYERSHRVQVADAVLINARRESAADHAPSFQALFCIDDREESLRRHIEEIAPECATYGVAGFYGLDIKYLGLHEHHPVPLCPVVITPGYLIEEVAEDTHATNQRVASNRRGMLRVLTRNIYDFSRHFVSGTIFTLVGGVFSCIPMVFRIHFPRVSGRVLERLKMHYFPSVVSDLLIERRESGTQQGLLYGFTKNEMAERVLAVLRGAGIRQFSRLVLVIAHGSSSLNNPHESAYDCGACGGRRGGPNARAFAKMANDSAVRRILAEKGFVIPEETWFVGGYHDTCSDDISYFDLQKVPERLAAALDKAKEVLERGRAFDAHERCRKFDDSRHFSPPLALRHVQGRAQSLREPRPEYNHSTNAVCVIGRRALTRELFLDRRAFLTSYDARCDEGGGILKALLSTVVPVCAGINLEYYFSFVDNEKYGCGTKLPHNVAGLIGVMNGSQSDLRTGLSWQMVEIHEPVRLVTLVEAPEDRVRYVLDEVPTVKRLVENRWIQLGIIDAINGTCRWFDGLTTVDHTPEETSLREYSTSRSYYDRRAEHLPPVLITRRGGGG